jgi:hypothetical protein
MTSFAYLVRASKFLVLAGFVGCIFAVVGCGGDGGGIVVKGKVEADGKPVTNGMLNITLKTGDGKTGRTIATKIGSNGEFVTSPEVKEGPAKITFVAPGPEFPAGYTPTNPYEPAPQSPYSKMKVKDEEVVIKAGTLLTIELINK